MTAVTEGWVALAHHRPAHVLRRTVLARLRAEEVAQEAIPAFVGHSSITITAGYGRTYPLARKLKTAERLDFGIDVLAELGGPYDKGRHG